MENTAVMEKHAEETRVSAFLKTIDEEKYKLILSACLILGIAMGAVSTVAYGNAGEWRGTAAAYCGSLAWAMLEITPFTLGFVAVLFACAPFGPTRLAICPAVCFRGMGLGALACGVIRAEGLMGLCFAGLVLLPYALINSVLAVRAGEFALGLRASLRQQNAGLRRGLLLHTFGIFALCLLAAAFSCGLFAISCAGFGKYLL